MLMIFIYFLKTCFVASQMDRSHLKFIRYFCKTFGGMMLKRY